MEEIKPWYKHGWKVAGLLLVTLTLMGLGLFAWRTYFFYTQIKEGKTFEELTYVPRKNPKPDQAMLKYLESMKSFVTWKKGEPFAGPATSTNEIVVFMDYDCEYSKQVVPVIRELIRSQPDVKVVMKDYPVSDIHPEALQGAKAARCVWNQNKPQMYWAYHERLFAEQGKHDLQNLKTMAVSLGADPLLFDKCMGDAKIEKLIKNSEIEGGKAGIRGTPTFFVNGYMMEGVVKKADLIQALE